MIFNQSLISQLCRVSPNTVSRAVSQLLVKPDDPEKAHKRYSFENTRLITDFIFASERRPIAKKTHVFYNFKGGTGKTSLCFQAATHLSLLGFKVLALDLDPQGHLSNALGIEEGWNGQTIYDVLINQAKLSDCLVRIMPGFDLLPANISMTRIEVPLSGKTKREEKLKVILEDFKPHYDFIVIDTNPTISTLNMNALVASDQVNVICETQPFSLVGLRVLVDEIESFYKEMKMKANYYIVPNKYEIKTATAQEVLGSLRHEYKEHVMSAVIRKSEDINIANKKHLPIAAFCRGKSVAFEDIMDFIHVLVGQSMEQDNTLLKSVL